MSHLRGALWLSRPGLGGKTRALFMAEELKTHFSILQPGSGEKSSNPCEQKAGHFMTSREAVVVK